MGMAETALTTLSDYIPIVHRRRVLVTALFCALCAILGLPLVTQGGVYVFQLVDWFFGTFTVIIIGITECVVLAWVYGADKFGDDIQMMIGRRPPLFMKLLWCFVTPAFLVILLVATLLQYQPPTYGDYYYGLGGNVFGWFVATVSFVPIPVVAVYQLYHARGTLLQRLRQTTRPGEKWGPADVNQRRLYQKELLRRQPRSGCYDIVCR
ncbi:hypothetical protein BaRGS_00009798 [Batillaria attramentaria]|uniref:Uncharacterized protein n=1 Tax=Batillaria attramentaria TaxID=370345 RepID=A0ABD0LHC4_9CAEN